MASVSPAIGDAAACTTASRPLTSIYRYERLGALGRGACAVVYKARDRCTGEAVAVKCFCPPGGGGGRQEDALAFARERHCLEACRGHPSVVQLRDVAVDPNCSWDK
uniref:Protein kinase domain-containing protein n=1 Tax=Oryza brachyantha TaxID=4533 RepID=J3N0Z7_ORYBR